MIITENLNDVTPTWVTPIKEQYNVSISPSQNMKRGYYLFSTTPILQYKLEFNGLSNELYRTLMEHWRAVSGTFGVFLWSTVPSYIDSIGGASPMYGRWISQPEVTPYARSWNVRINFEKDFNYIYGNILDADGIAIKDADGVYIKGASG
jgi:hypothetical protein